ncbi:hypothetical protein D9619_008665 [Psilocybe cf. subviscida]|uniref:Uncharacterized protein n=1 Tax=Psilocybe cf. subviscida TaxID=2480587 RepID=A0A8H5BAI8_9AGAR|nr:hypothetical protein D9619_008665 [Psilocybe cf. subviscida]
MPASKYAPPDLRPVDILLAIDETIKVEGEKQMTTQMIKLQFAETIQKRYDVKRKDALKAINESDVVAFVPVREEKIDNEWVAATLKNNRDTMANVFSEHHTGLFLLRLSEEFKSTHGSSQVHPIDILGDKEPSEDTSQKILQLMARLEKMEAALEAATQRSKKTEAALEAATQRSKKTEAALEAKTQRSKKTEAALEAETQRLKEDLGSERKRALLAEKNLAQVSANMEEINDFIANGSREDTTAFYCIKIRHLVSLVQGQLAYTAGWSSSPDDRSGSRIWRAKLAELDSIEKKIARAKRDLKKCSAEDREHLQKTIIASDALKILVDDSDLRDTAAHPGPLTKDNAEGYRTAIQAIGKHKSALEGCITFLLEK